MGSSETCTMTETKLKRIAWLSASDTDKRFDSLMHHFNEESLAACFDELDGTKAVGIDGVTKAQYGENLDENLSDLVARMKRMAYRPQPIRQALIPKAGQPGATRELGIRTFYSNYTIPQFPFGMGDNHSPFSSPARTTL